MNFPWKERISLHGDWLVRAKDACVPFFPVWLEKTLTSPLATLFFLIATPARRALIKNFEVLFPESTPWERFWKARRVFVTFAAGLGDAAHVRAGQKDVIEWETEGLEHFEALRTSETGAVVLTAHMGNYDIAAAQFADKFKRLIAIRAPERTAAGRALKEEQFARDETESFAVRFNTGSENLLGIELVHAISRGEVVAIQGDRVLFEMSPMQAPFSDGKSLRIPKGPFYLAMTTNAPIYPLFVIRTGFRRYKILVKAPIYFPEKIPREQRSREIAAAADEWIEALRPVVMEHWDQWYVFEDAFREA